MEKLVCKIGIVGRWKQIGREGTKKHRQFVGSAGLGGHMGGLLYEKFRGEEVISGESSHLGSQAGGLECGNGVVWTTTKTGYTKHLD